jgi:hypothetical protein
MHLGGENAEKEATRRRDREKGLPLMPMHARGESDQIL